MRRSNGSARRESRNNEGIYRIEEKRRAYLAQMLERGSGLIPGGMTGEQGAARRDLGLSQKPGCVRREKEVLSQSGGCMDRIPKLEKAIVEMEPVLVTGCSGGWLS